MALSGNWRMEKTGGSTLKLLVALTCTGERDACIISNELLIDDLVKVRFQWSSKKCKDNDAPEISTKLSLSKCDADNNSSIKINFTSEILEYSAIGIHTLNKWSEWELIGTTKPNVKTVKPLVYTIIIDILITVYQFNIDMTFPKLYSDTDFTDFALSTTGGSVPIHKVCLAAHSDVFRAMLKGEWKETAEGQVNIQGVTLDTLEQLKKYLYLSSVPDDVDELCSLLLVARRYIIEDLEKHCIRVIAETVSSEELFSIIEFACENQIPELPFAILQVTEDSVVNEAYKIKKQAMVKAKIRDDKIDES
ncbi:BTB/POZ domain-containing protein 9-like [Cydia pomonella]|uniref:BTB/POZ domain-containing protein 9-like n=1 Tax=Cydia pomonella TaxID=82600 RepID=UPI002ADDDAA2|nr:BTB/POZ domain-containing protein 9-like [Cydia pomonella]